MHSLQRTEDELRFQEGLAVSNEAHVSRNVVIADGLSIESSHSGCAVANEDAVPVGSRVSWFTHIAGSLAANVPSPVVCVRDSAQQALVGVDTSEEQRLLAALTKPLVHRQVRVPHATHTGLVETDVLWRHDLLERLVDVGVPGAAEEAALGVALVILDVGTQANVPAVALVLRQVSVETSCDSCGHDLEIVVGDSPVQPAALDSEILALVDDFQHRVNGGDTTAVVVVHGVYEEVLHVDYDKNSGRWVDGTASGRAAS